MIVKVFLKLFAMTDSICFTFQSMYLKDIFVQKGQLFSSLSYVNLFPVGSKDGGVWGKSLRRNEERKSSQNLKSSQIIKQQ